MSAVDFAPNLTNIDFKIAVDVPLPSGFKALTGCPILVDTSLNVRGEPICVLQKAE